MQRREFLKVVGSVLAGGILSACSPKLTENTGEQGETDLTVETKEDKNQDTHNTTGNAQHVIVIGAGIAGLAAARLLTQQGVQVTVLEGRDRIGGRVFTDHRWDNAPVDLGASWIHRSLNNPITALADEINAPRVITDYDNYAAYHSDGRPFTEADYERADTLLEEMWERLVVAQDADEDQSLEAFVQADIAEQALSAEDQQLLLAWLNTTIEHEYAGSLSQLSTYWFDDGEEFDGDDVVFPEGYSAVADFLADGLTIKLEQIVTAVERNEATVTVQTESGSYTADQVVVTLPLGVLQTGTVTFTPPLPTAKQTAIAALGMGVLNKCIFRFPKVFWPQETTMLEYVAEKRGAWGEFLNLAEVLDVPVLVGFNAADYGRKIESWTDAEIIADGMVALRAMFGADIPEPDDYIITRWGQDRFAQGSYSFMAVDTDPEMRDQLGSPVDNQLFFAGEATSRAYAATVHGAYLSGIRAAEEILAL